jgi:hypothetical protein
MRVTKLVVSATRKVPSPVQEFSSLSALVSYEAELGVEDDLAHCTAALQARAEEAVDSHLRKLSASIAARERKDREAERAKKGTELTAAKLIAKHGREPF